MASFIPWYGKKHSRLAEREREFLAALRNGGNDDRLAKSAEAIRTAQIRALKEKRQKFAPSEENAAIYEDIDQAIRWWTNLATDAIVDGYRDPKRRHRMSAIPHRTSG